MSVKTQTQRSKGKAKSKSVAGKPIQMSKKKRIAELIAFIQLCFVMFDDMSFAQIAEKSGLSESTIRRLAFGPVSLLVRFGTIQAFGLAAGIKLDPVEMKMRAIVTD